MGDLLALATRRTTMAHIRHVTPVVPAAAAGPVGRVYRQVARDFGMLAPPVVLHSPSPDALAASWVLLRESLLTPGPASRPAREAVAAAVSLANSCPYCVEVHGATLAGLVRNPDAAAVADDRVEAVTDPDLRAVAHWARSGGAATAGQPPFPVPQATALTAVALTFHYLNRMVNVFLQESPLMAVPPRARGGARRVAARLMGALARRDRDPGGSLDLLPAAALPADLAWAADSPHLAAALARTAAAIDDCGARSVPADVRRLVQARLATWTGDAPALAAAEWLDGALAELAPEHRPAGRLAMLTAFASYRVTDEVVAGYRQSVTGRDAAGGPGGNGAGGDGALVEVAAWASLAAARRMAARLHARAEALPGA